MDRGNSKVADLPARLEDCPSPNRERPEGASFEIGPQFREETFNAAHGLDIAGSLAVHPGRACAPVTPHPIPPDQQEGRIGDEIEQIIEPAMRIIFGPTVQFGLDLQYPSLRPHGGGLQIIGIHR
jgi:hypothetical protein